MSQSLRTSWRKKTAGMKKLRQCHPMYCLSRMLRVVMSLKFLTLVHVMPELRLSSRPLSGIAGWPVPNCTAWRQGIESVNNLPRGVVLTTAPRPGFEPATFSSRADARSVSPQRHPLYQSPYYGRPMEYGRPLYFHPVVSSSSFFFSSPNLSRRRVDVCRTCTHGVALLRI